LEIAVRLEKWFNGRYGMTVANDLRSLRKGGRLVYWVNANISDLVGRTMRSVRRIADDELRFECESGAVFRMLHKQDCCESVAIEDICGDLEDLVGSPITKAEESSSEESLGARDPYDESYTWTFYHFATVKGYVTVRWYGTSNGYYSESVDFERKGDGP